MATIEAYETSDGKRYQVRFRTPERKQTKRRSFRTKRDAEQFAAAVEVQKYRGEFIAHQAGQVTIGELGPDWLTRQSAHLKPSSLLALEVGWRVHVEPRWRDVRVSDISRTAIQDWVAALGADRSATTVKRAYGVLSSILDDAVADRRILANPAKGVKTKRRATRGRVYLNHRQVECLAREAGDSAGVVLVLAYTGIRWGEMIALRVHDVDTTRRRLSIERNAVEVGTEIHIGTPKNHERRSVPYIQMLDSLFDRVCAGKPPDALLFPGVDGNLRRRTRTDGSSGGWFAGVHPRRPAFFVSTSRTVSVRMRFDGSRPPEASRGSAMAVISGS
ncbi:Arm DNA-binding domain-containing protein [Aeromicrobium sp. CF4.19]|uniref:Arm DNA-binding domain-containing protein n=1 Tax=Aeromicrobium sp. CF4.19 TaxID=3373082 RepID=UPI003EE59925